MAKQRNVRAGLCFFAAVLTGSLAITASFAKPAHWRTHLAAHHGTQSGKIGPSRVSTVPFNHDRTDGKDQSGNQQGPKARNDFKPAQDSVPANNQPAAIQRGAKHDAKGAPIEGGNAHETSNGQPASSPNVPEFHMRDLGPVETRITVQPLVGADKPHPREQAKTKFKLTVPVNGRGNQNQVRKTPEVERNAIGISIAPHHNGRGNDKPANLHVTMGDHGTPPPLVVKANIAVQTNANQESVRPGIIRTNSNPVTPPVVINRGAINGSRMLRRGFAPAAVGGPPRIIAGISGTMFRPKH
jgi:hypothetical protein